MTDRPFNLHDKVQKKEGYRFPGIITGFDSDAMNKCLVTTYHPEFVGMKHIFSFDQLEHRSVDLLMVEKTMKEAFYVDVIRLEDRVKVLEKENEMLKLLIDKERHERH